MLTSPCSPMPLGKHLSTYHIGGSVDTWSSLDRPRKEQSLSSAGNVSECSFYEYTCMWCVLCYFCGYYVELLVSFVLLQLHQLLTGPDVSKAGITGQLGVTVTVTLYLYSGDSPFESPPGRRISVTLMWFSIFNQKNSGLVISLVQESFSITFQFIIHTSSSYSTQYIVLCTDSYVK